MENNNTMFIKTDNNIIINEKSIKWVKKMDDCLAVCTKSMGCNKSSLKDTHKICKLNSVESYIRLNKYFE